MLLKNNTCCFCCQKLMILFKSEKNRHHKWELTYETREGPNLLLICCHGGLLPICCQFVILLKSYSWQHMWRPKSIFKNCQKSRFFENLRILDWFWIESSTCVHDATFDAESNIVSLLPIFNKNVVFRHQMLIFHDDSH